MEAYVRARCAELNRQSWLGGPGAKDHCMTWSRGSCLSRPVGRACGRCGRPSLSRGSPMLKILSRCYEPLQHTDLETGCHCPPAAGPLCAPAAHLGASRRQGEEDRLCASEPELMRTRVRRFGCRCRCRFALVRLPDGWRERCLFLSADQPCGRRAYTLSCSAVSVEGAGDGAAAPPFTSTVSW